MEDQQLLATVAGEFVSAYLSLKQTFHPVGGRILCDGEPAGGVKVVFHPIDATKCWDMSVIAYTDADGEFFANASTARRGLPVGKYVVTVEWRTPIMDDDDFLRNPNLLPVEFASLAETSLRVEVLSGKNILPTWRFRSRAVS